MTTRRAGLNMETIINLDATLVRRHLKGQSGGLDLAGILHLAPDEGQTKVVIQNCADRKCHAIVKRTLIDRTWPAQRYLVVIDRQIGRGKNS